MAAFIDKKKTVRKIKQIKKRLGEDDADDAERKELEAQLLARRIDLNYILVRINHIFSSLHNPALILP